VTEETALEVRLRRVRRALGIAELRTKPERNEYLPPAKAWPVPAHVIAALAMDCSGWSDERINVIHSLIAMLDDSDESAAAIKAECAGLVAELRRVHG
jgi:hypothetical protein